MSEDLNELYSFYEELEQKQKSLFWPEWLPDEVVEVRYAFGVVFLFGEKRQVGQLEAMPNGEFWDFIQESPECVYRKSEFKSVEVPE